MAERLLAAALVVHGHFDRHSVGSKVGGSGVGVVPRHGFGAQAGEGHHQLAGNVAGLHMAHDGVVTVHAAFTFQSDGGAGFGAQSFDLLRDAGGEAFHILERLGFTDASSAGFIAELVDLAGVFGHLGGETLELLFVAGEAFTSHHEFLRGFLERQVQAFIVLVGSGESFLVHLNANVVGVLLGGKGGHLFAQGGGFLVFKEVQRLSGHQMSSVAIGAAVAAEDVAEKAVATAAAVQQTEGSASNRVYPLFPVALTIS